MEFLLFITLSIWVLTAQDITLNDVNAGDNTTAFTLTTYVLLSGDIL